MNTAPRPLRQVIGEGARRLRTTAGKTRDEVSRTAHTFGLAWSYSKLCELEGGTKAVRPEDIFLLIALYTRLCGRPVTLADMIDPGASIEITPVVQVTGREFVDCYAGRAVPVYAPPRVVAGLAERQAAKKLGVKPAAVLSTSIATWGRTLTEERDRIVAERHPDASPDRRRALRGRVTRELLGQLGDELDRREEGTTP